MLPGASQRYSSPHIQLSYLPVEGRHGDRGRARLVGTHLHGVRLTLSWKAVMSHSSTSRLEPRFSAAMNCSRFSCFMPGVLKISRSLCHDCLS